MGISDWLEEATPDRRELTVCLDRRLVSALASARKELEQIPETEMLGQGAVKAAIQKRIEDLEAQIREKQRVLVFEGIGWGAWRDLIGEHPPQADQADTFKRAVELLFMPHAVENVGYNAETFIPASISASCSEPGISIHEAETLIRKAPPGVLERIWSAVLEVNLAGNDDPFVAPASANGSGGARATRKK